MTSSNNYSHDSDKLTMHTSNLVDSNIDKIAELFPNCITESQNEQGELERAIDFELLKQELSHHVVDGSQERYRLDWVGKRQAILEANTPIAKTLRPVRGESVNFDTTENLFIEGDNLDALKLLQESYLGKVKMIYIDPPYNTGNDFIYEDDFAESTQDFLQRSEQIDEDGNRLVANSESNGRFHSDWLTMMYSRLKLARNLLSDDGVIFISIDDNEVHNLRKICDEVFGEQNFQTNISWQKRYTRSNNTIKFTTVVEHIIAFAKSEEFLVNLLPRTEEADSRYTNPDNDPRGPWKGASFLNPATPEQRPNLCYPIVNPNTGNTTEPTRNAWRRSKKEFDRLLEENKLYWGTDGKQNVPSIKMFLSEARGLTPTNFWEHTYAGNTDEGTSNLFELFKLKLFENPKPTQLVKRVIEHSCERNDLILDFFAGSATTAHAVMDLNAQDGGKRKFIMVQLPEITDEKSEAHKAGYKTIAEISKERIRRAGEKIVADNADKDGIENLDIGFRVLKVDSSNMKDVYYRPDEYSQDILAQMQSNIEDDRTAEDLLFQVMLDWGVPLDLPIASQNIQGKNVYFVGGNSLVASFDAITPTMIDAIVQAKPLKFVSSERAIEKDQDKSNIKERFRQLSPETEIKFI